MAELNLNNIVAQVGQLVAGAVVLLEEEDDEEEVLIMQAARVAVAEIMWLEDGIVDDDLDGEAWVKVTVDINEYHTMGDPCFKLHFRMCRSTFEALCGALYRHLVAVGRLRRYRTPFQDIVVMVIWVMATPDSFRSVSLRFGVRPSTLWDFYSYIIEALRELAPAYIKWPDEEEKAEIKEAFRRTTGFPGVVGCVDGTHVYITAPVLDPAHYKNRHHTYSMNVQVVVDNSLLVRDLHVGEPGSMHDQRVFQRSPLYAKLLREQALSADNEHLLGDGGYTLTDFMMIPFKNNGHLTDQQIDFNKTLSQGRVRVENSFSLAKEKWRRLKFLHARNHDMVVDYITAAFVLHNFLILEGETVLEEADLARAIRPNQVLGDEAADNEAEDEVEEQLGEMLDAAQLRGIEKRLWIMNDLLPHAE